MTHGSLFSGIGGFDLAAEWMSWENKFHCEWNEFGQKVLHHYWPQAELFTDIKKSNFTKYANRIDVLSGGFPCQPYSSAGKRLGKEDDRHLWPEMLRAIREIYPRWVVGENVRGLTNWNGGVVFDEVQADLEAEGYEVTPFLLPACAVNAPHKRDRIWFVAYSTCTSERRDKFRGIRQHDAKIDRERTQTIYDAIRPDGFEGDDTNSNGNGLNQCNGNNEINTSEERLDALSNINEINGNGDVADTKGKRSWEQQPEDKRREDRRFNDNGEIQYASNTNGIGLWGQSNRIGESRFYGKDSKRNNWQNFPTQSPICTGDDGLSNRLDGITFSKWRNESIKAAGNAIVPQVVYQIFKAIEEYDK